MSRSTFRPWFHLINLCLVGLCCTALAADIKEIKANLEQLKTMCDDKLLTEEECKTERQKLVALLSKELTKNTEQGSGTKDVWFCNYGGQDTPGAPLSSPNGSSFSESASAGIAVRELLDTAGLVGNFVVRPANVPNAMASVRMGERFIEYNPTFVEQLKTGTSTNWSVYSVLAHEIGHHLQGHTLRAGGSRPDLELEADEYSGFLLAKMGSSLADAQKAMQTFGSDTSSGTHPEKKLRLAAIKKGWDNATSKKAKAPIQDDAKAVPTVQTPLPEQLPPPLQPQPMLQFAFRCVINGEQVVIDQTNRVLSVPRGGMQVGQRIPSTHPNCAFNLAAPPTGVYCVGYNGYVFFGTPIPVGQCMQCGPGGC
jgi:hypothetical protein